MYAWRSALVTAAVAGSTYYADHGYVDAVVCVRGTGRSYDRSGHAVRPYGTFTGESPLIPGQDYRLEFPMSSRVAEVAPGHALRLTVTTQTPASACGKLLRYEPCHPTVPQQRTLPGTYRLRLGVSAVNLPLAPYGCFPASGGTGAGPNSFRGPVDACR